MREKLWEIRTAGGRILAHRAVAAESFRTRLCGMIGRRFEKESFDGMFFRRCGSIHTWWMGCAIDAVFIDRHGQVVRCCASLKPWRLAFGGRGAETVIELPAGKAKEIGVKAGEKLLFSPVK